MSRKIKYFKSHSIFLTLWEGREDKPNYITISRVHQVDGDWKFIPFLREIDLEDVLVVTKEYLANKDNVSS